MLTWRPLIDLWNTGPKVIKHQQDDIAICEPWCLYIYIYLPTKLGDFGQGQFCRDSYTSTMVRIWHRKTRIWFRNNLVRLISAQNPSCVIPSETGWFIGIPRFTGWWFQPTPLKNITVVSWDDDIPNWMEKKKKTPTSLKYEWIIFPNKSGSITPWSLLKVRQSQIMTDLCSPGFVVDETHERVMLGTVQQWLRDPIPGSWCLWVILANTLIYG